MLLSWSGTPGTSFGAFIWSGGDAVLNQHIFKVPIYSELLDKAFLKMAINASLDALIGGARGGVGLKHVTKGQVEALLLPIPPVEEQKRIVEKVDELMFLCDQLEAQQQDQELRFPVLSRTCHTRFAEAPTPANLNCIFDETGSVLPADLRKTILSLAVEGKLARKDPKDGPTTVVTMEELVGRKNLKNGLSLSPSPGATDFVCLPLSAVSGSNLNCSSGKPIAISAERAAPYLIKPGDIFIMRGNGSKERVGIAAMARTTPPNVLFPDLLIRIPLPKQKMDGEYFLIAWNNPLTRKTVETLAATTAGIWKINQGHISECSIPLPPLAEQRRIVAKVDELMTLVDQLEAQQEERNKLAEAFATACVASFTGTAQFERPEKMKAPKTELVSLVTLGKKPKAAGEAPLAQILSRHKGTLPAKSLWQQSGLTIDAFYQHLKTEISQGWIAPPAEAEMKILEEV